MGAPVAVAAAFDGGMVHIPLMTVGALLAALDGDGLQELAAFGHGLVKLLRIKKFAAKTAFEGRKFDDFGAEGALFSGLVVFGQQLLGRPGGLGSSRRGQVAANEAAFGVKREGQEPPAEGNNDGKEGAEAQFALMASLFAASRAETLFMAFALDHFHPRRERRPG